MAGNLKAAATCEATMVERLQAMLDCLAAQQAAMIRGDLAEVQRHAHRFDQIRAGLDAGAFHAAGGGRAVRDLLQAVADQHQRLLTAAALLREEVAEQLRQLRRGQPAVTAYGRQAAAAAGTAPVAAARHKTKPASDGEGAGSC